MELRFVVNNGSITRSAKVTDREDTSGLNGLTKDHARPGLVFYRSQPVNAKPGHTFKRFKRPIVMRFYQTV